MVKRLQSSGLRTLLSRRLLFFSLLLGFHFLSFRNRFCYPLQIRRKKITMSVFFAVSFPRDTNAKATITIFRVIGVTESNSQDLPRTRLIDFTSLNATIICNNYLFHFTRLGKCSWKCTCCVKIPRTQLSLAHT